MKKLTPMQEFALALLKEKGGEVSAHRLAIDWAIHKTGRHRTSSRDRFGYTSAAYRTMRRLVDLGLANHEGYSGYSLKQQP